MTRHTFLTACLLLGQSTGIALLGSANAALAFDELKWATYTHDGQKAFDIQNYGGAERNWTQALLELKGASDADKTSHLGDSLTNLANLYSSRGQFAKAEAYYDKALKVREFVSGASDKRTIASQVKLCQLYLSQGKRDKAMPLVDKLADLGEAQARELNEVLNSFNKLQRFVKAHKTIEASSRATVDSEQKKVDAIKDRSQDIAIFLDSLGTSLKDVRTDHAQKQVERLYKSALAIRQRTLSPEHAALASSLENLGRLYQSQGKMIKAETLLRRSYEISLDTLGSDRMETSQRLDLLAQVLSNEGKFNEAETLYHRALDPTPAAAVPKNGGDKSAPKTGGGRNQADMAANMASLLVKEGRYSAAVPYYGRALKIQESINGPQHASLVKLLDSYAYALSKANRGSEAARLTARARSIGG